MSLKLLLIVMSLVVIYSNPLVAQRLFTEFQQDYQQNFLDFLISDSLKYEEYKKGIEKKWDHFIESSEYHWTSYASDELTKSVIYFDSGYVKIDVLIEDKDKSNPELVKGKIEKCIRQMLELEIVANGDKVLELYDTNRNKIITSRTIPNMNNCVDTVVELKEPIRGKDGIPREHWEAIIQMPSNHIEVRARKYFPLVQKYSSKYNIDPAVVMAIIHVESCFNPFAKSSCSALGLMQIVPTSGGTDAYKYIFGEEIIPTHEYLYNAENNIRLGVGYLAKLRDHDFKGIKDNNNMLYCQISAYNTGSYNVARAFNEKPSLADVIKIINKMSNYSLLNKLYSDLPYRETRTYLRKVLKKLDGYNRLQF